MSFVDRLSTDATTPAVCTRQTHDAVKLNADMFAAATKYVGVSFDGLILGNCFRCHSTIAFDPDEWDDGPTLPMVNAIARPL